MSLHEEKRIAVLYLVQRSGRISHHRIPLVHEVYTFGSGAHCDISIRRDTVAREHMRLRCVGAGVYAIENTWIDAESGARIGPNEVALRRGTRKWNVDSPSEVLCHRDLITIAKRRFFFAVGSTAVPNQDTQSFNHNVAFSQISLDAQPADQNLSLIAPPPPPPRPVAVSAASPRRRSLTPIPDIVEVVNVTDEPTVPVPSSPVRAVEMAPPQSPATPLRSLAPLPASATRTPSPAPPKQSPAPSETSGSFVGRRTPPRTFRRRILDQDDGKQQRSASPQANVASTSTTKAPAAAAVAATPPRPASSVASSPLKSPAKKPERAAAAAAKKAAVAAAAAAEPTDDNKRVAVVDKRKRGGARPLGKYRVMVSSVTGDRWVTKLKALGADVINSETIENLRVRNNDKLIACVHYLADVPKASFKLLLALAVGAPIVSFEWIAACDKAAAYVDTAPYELPLNKVIDSDLPARRSVDRLQSMAGHRVELIGGTDAERKQLTLVLERLDVKVVKGDNRVLGNYELSAAISFGGPRAFARTEEMRAHRYTVVGIKWLKHCLVNGYVDPSDEKFAADEAMWLAGNHDDDDINNNGDNNEDTDDSDDEDSQPKPQRPSLRSKRKQPPAVVSKVEEDDEDEQSQSAAQEVASQAIVHKPKRSRVLESQADDVSHGGGAAPPLMVVEETDDEREEVDIDNIDDDSIVNVVDDIVDDAAADELVPPTQRSTSRSLVVPSDSLTMSPPAQEVRDTGELSLAFDEIGVSQMPAAATATVVRVVSRPMTPISSPPATAHLPQRRRAVEAVFSATLPSSDDEEEKEKPVNDLGSVVAARKYTAAMLPLAVHDREFEKEQRARDEDEMNGISRHYPAATQYS